MSDDRNQQVITTYRNYKREAEDGKRERMWQTERNFRFYHRKQDFAHKKAGQSREFLPKQAMAVEQITSFLHQGLIDFGDWFSVEPKPHNKEPLLTGDQIRSLLLWQHKRMGFMAFVMDIIKSGLLGGLMISKTSDVKQEVPEFFAKKGKNKIELRRTKNRKSFVVTQLIRQQDYFPDPTGEGLYEIFRTEMDWWKFNKMAKDNPDMFDMGEVAKTRADNFVDHERQNDKEKETDQTTSEPGYRRRVVIDEVWGTIISADGDVMDENMVCWVANEKFLVMPPRPNPFWHGKSPIITAGILRVPGSVWPKALMDAPTELNQAINELYNLMLDDGMMSVWGVRQIREHWIENVEDLNEGIGPLTTLKANAACPPGQKVLETVQTSEGNAEALSMLRETNGEFSLASLTNDLRLGNLPAQQVKATAIVEASQSINSVFTGVAKVIEDELIAPILTQQFAVMMQEFNDFDDKEIQSIIGEEKAKELKKMEAEERFERTIEGHDFKVFGMTQTLDKIKDFRKWTSLLQTIGASEQLTEAFEERFSQVKLLAEFMRGLDINIDRVKKDEIDNVMNEIGDAEETGQAGAPVVGANEQSQIPQAAAGNQQNVVSALPQTNFPTGTEGG